MIEIEDEFQSGLEGIEDYGLHLYSFVFDRSRGWSLRLRRRGAEPEACSRPDRPTVLVPIGLTAVR